MNFLHEKLTPPDTCKLTVTHFLNIRGVSSAFDEKAIFKCLPTRIVSKIVWEQNASDIHSIRLFQHFSHSRHRGIIVYLLRLMSAVTYEDKAYVVEEGIVASELIFLIRGKCDVLKRVPKSTSTRRNSSRDENSSHDVIKIKTGSHQNVSSSFLGWRHKGHTSSSLAISSGGNQ